MGNEVTFEPEPVAPHAVNALNYAQPITLAYADPIADPPANCRILYTELDNGVRLEDPPRGYGAAVVNSALRARAATTMSEPMPILDYASPRKRSAFRLASKSVISHGWQAGGYRVREWLIQQEGAVGLIVLGLVMTALAGLVVYREWHRTDVVIRCIFCGVFLVQIGLVPVVIQQTWRETLLVFFDGAVRLSMGGPLGRRYYEWPYDRVQSIRLIVTQREPGQVTLGEIEILAAGVAPIRLFTDHTELELSQVVPEIERAVAGASE